MSAVKNVEQWCTVWEQALLSALLITEIIIIIIIIMMMIMITTTTTTTNANSLFTIITKNIYKNYDKFL